MSTLLVIQGYKAAEERLHRHWGYFLRAGCDILGVGREGAPINWPAEGLIGCMQWGKDGYVTTGELPAFLLKCFEFALPREGPRGPYTDFCVIENDSIITAPIPTHPGGLVSLWVDDKDKAFHGNGFLHTPWWADRATARKIVDYGNRMLDCRLTEHGFPDRFLGLLTDLYDIQGNQANAFSVNLIDRPEFVQAAREAIKNGAFYVHGIKSGEQLRAVTEGLL